MTDAFLLLCYPSSLADSCACLAAVGLEAGSQGGPHLCLSKSSRGLSKGTQLTRSFSPLMCTSFQFGKCSVINIFSEFPGNLGLMTGFLIITTNVVAAPAATQSERTWTGLLWSQRVLEGKNCSHKRRNFILIMEIIQIKSIMKLNNKSFPTTVCDCVSK